MSNFKYISRKSNDSNENYELLSYQFQSVINRRTPLKTKIIRGIDASFVN